MNNRGTPFSTETLIFLAAGSFGGLQLLAESLSGLSISCKMLLHPRSVFLSKGNLYQYITYSQSVQFSHSVMSNSVMPWTGACQASQFITNSWNLLKLISIKLVLPSNHLILCQPLFLLPSIFPGVRVFSNESVLPIRWPKYWNFISFSISPSNEYSGLISFRMDWLDLLAVQETLKSLLQHHSSKSSILQYSAFFIVQLSHPYMTTGNTIGLTRWIFVDKVMSLLLICCLVWS